MNDILTGSDLARAMLMRGEKEIWCAVADSSDQEAMMDLRGNDFTLSIVSFEQGVFHCTGGTEWAFAVPIKIVALTESE